MEVFNLFLMFLTKCIYVYSVFSHLFIAVPWKSPVGDMVCTIFLNKAFIIIIVIIITLIIIVYLEL